AEARKAVQELARKRADFVKIRVATRNGTRTKLAREMFSAAADEARKLGLRSIAHVFDLADAKLLVRAGVEGFLHSIRDQEVDDEFIKLAKERDRKSTRLNSSHVKNSYAVFCLKKKTDT